MSESTPVSDNRAVSETRAVSDDFTIGELAALVALAPPGLDRVNALVRTTCATTLSLPALPVEFEVDGPESQAEEVLVEFAEQFSADVSSIGEDVRNRFTSALAGSAFPAVILMYFADFLPRVGAGLAALGFSRPWSDAVNWEHDSDLGDVLFNRFLPGVARLRSLDPVTTEVVRLRGATQHNCRLCTSLRDGTALDAGGSESLYEQIERYETSGGLSDRHRAALRYADALIWTPAAIGDEVAGAVRAHFSDAEAVELTLDVMRNASNKIAVSMGADAPHVTEGTERYSIDESGHPVYSR